VELKDGDISRTTTFFQYLMSKTYNRSHAVGLQVFKEIGIGDLPRGPHSGVVWVGNHLGPPFTTIIRVTLGWPLPFTTTYARPGWCYDPRVYRVRMRQKTQDIK